MNGRTRALNRLLDVAQSEAVMGRVHRISGRAAGMAERLRGQTRALVEGVGVASRVDLADVTAELAAVTDATERLSRAVDRLTTALNQIGAQTKHHRGRRG